MPSVLWWAHAIALGSARLLWFAAASVGLVDLVRRVQQRHPLLRRSWFQGLLLALVAAVSVEVGFRWLHVLDRAGVVLVPAFLALVGEAEAAWIGAAALALVQPGQALPLIVTGAAAGLLARTRCSPLLAVPLGWILLLALPGGHGLTLARAGRWVGDVVGSGAGLALFAYYVRSVDWVRRQQLLLERTSQTDPLTGALNRAGLEAWLARAAGATGALLMVDLDDFKSVNEAYGHPAGDAVLRQVVERLREVLPQDAPLVRYGGDEFQALLPNADEQQGLELARAIVRTVAQRPFRLPGAAGSAILGASVGVAAGPLGQITEPADAALMIAKAHGKGHAELARAQSGTVHDEEMLLRVGAQLLRALAHAPDGFVLTDLSHRYVAVSPTFVRLAGLGEGAWRGKTPKIVASGLTEETHYREMHRALAQSGHWNGELLDRRPDGELWCAEWSMARLDLHGRAIGYWGTVRDRTPDHRANAERLTDLVGQFCARREPSIDAHLRRCGRYTALVVRQWHARHGRAGLDVDPEELGLAARLHDVGKLDVPVEVLRKPGPLTPEELQLVQVHPRAGHQFLLRLASGWNRGEAADYFPRLLGWAAEIAMAHHERWDGTGYPLGTRGERIPLCARLFAVVDIYDALRSQRSYKQPWPEPQTVQHLLEQAGRGLDPRAVDTVLSLTDSTAWEAAGGS